MQLNQSALVSALMLVVMFCFLSATNLQAQTGTSAADTGNHAQIASSVFGLGANFSPLSGIGVSVRQHFPARISYMICGYYAKSDATIDYSYGIELQYDLILKDRVRFYALAGASHFFDGTTSDTYAAPNRIGGGFGIETNLIGEDFCLLVDGMFVSYSNGDFLPAASGGLHYYFR